MQWHHPMSPTTEIHGKQIKSKIRVTIFWDTQPVMVVDLLTKEGTVNSAEVTEILKRLRARWNLELNEDLQPNAKPHWNLTAKETTSSFRWTSLIHPPFSPDSSLLHLNIFSPMKEAVQDKHCSEEKFVGSVSSEMKLRHISTFWFLLSHGNRSL